VIPPQIGLVIVCIALTVLLLIAASKNSNSSSSSCSCSSSNICSCTEGCCDCCCTSGSSIGPHLYSYNFWYGPPWWYYWWPTSSYSYRSAITAQRPAPAAVISCPAQESNFSNCSAAQRSAAPSHSTQLATVLPSAPPATDLGPTSDRKGRSSSDNHRRLDYEDEDPRATDSLAVEWKAPGQHTFAQDGIELRESFPVLLTQGDAPVAPVTIRLQQLPPPPVFDNPHKWKQCGVVSCVQVVLALAIVGIAVSSWKTFGCIVLVAN
jgi:hypothetical protein